MPGELIYWYLGIFYVFCGALGGFILSPRLHPGYKQPDPCRGLLRFVDYIWKSRNQSPREVSGSILDMKIPIIAFLLLIVQSLSAQQSASPSSSREGGTSGVYIVPCVKKTRFSFASRIKHYPFNLSAQVQLISFDGLVKLSDNGEFRFFSQDPPLVDGTDTTWTSPVGLKEIRTLTLKQIDSLTDILYNYGFARKPNVARVMQCYSPRNAILFRDNNGKVIAFIELCFECQNTRESSDKISLGEMCEQKFDLLKALFSQVGIEYGTVRELRAESEPDTDNS